MLDGLEAVDAAEIRAILIIPIRSSSTRYRKRVFFLTSFTKPTLREEVTGKFSSPVIPLQENFGRQHIVDARVVQPSALVHQRESAKTAAMGAHFWNRHPPTKLPRCPAGKIGFSLRTRSQSCSANSWRTGRGRDKLERQQHLTYNTEFTCSSLQG